MTPGRLAKKEKLKPSEIGRKGGGRCGLELILDVNLCEFTVTEMKTARRVSRAKLCVVFSKTWLLESL